MRIRNYKYQILGILPLLLLALNACSRPHEHQQHVSSSSLQQSAETRPLRAKSSPGARVFFINIKNGDTLKNPVRIVFGTEGVETAPAGEVKDNSGHHHLLIDVATLPPMDQPLPMTDQIRHFGKGQTETEITLSPGPHTLQLLLAGGNHVPNNPPVMSEKITINVQ